jgi:alpha,alpha-trehalose phosphorylase
MEYFNYALLMDLGDIAGNASSGVHIASAAGVWSALVLGFGGVRDYEGRLSFAPRLPRLWSELSFSLRFRDRQLRVRLGQEEEWYLVETGDPLEVTIRGETHLLDRGMALTLKPPPRPHNAAAPGYARPLS